MLVVVSWLVVSPGNVEVLVDLPLVYTVVVADEEPVLREVLRLAPTARGVFVRADTGMSPQKVRRG